MAKATTALQLLDIQRRRFGRVSKSMTVNHARMAVLGREDLEELTLGKIPQATIRKLRPFARGTAPNTGTARRRGRSKGVIPLRPINKHTGRLHSGIFLKSNNPNEHEVGSRAPYAKYILHPSGTRKMVGRGVMTGHAIGKFSPWGELEVRHRARRRILREAFLTSNRSQ